MATREARFWGYVDRSGECWLWTRSTSGKGYGQFTIGHGRNALAHRTAWEFATGDILTTSDAIGHTCDTPRCVRNDEPGWYEVSGITLPRRGHLFKGTVGDNNRDMFQKDRGSNGLKLHPERIKRGSAVPWSRLTEEQVLTIRARYATGGITQVALAEEFGVTFQAISSIVRRKNWQHL